MCKRSEKCNRIFKHQFEIIQTPVWNSKTTICKTNPPFETETRVENLKCCILLHLIYHKDKTGVVYSKRCNITYVIAYCCIRYITRTKLVLCIQKGAISPYAFAYRCITYNNRTCIRVSRRPLSSPNSYNHLWLLSSNKERNYISFTLPFLSLLLFTICNVCLLGQSSNRSPKTLRWFFFVVQYFGIVLHSSPYLPWWDEKGLTDESQHKRNSETNKSTFFPIQNQCKKVWLWMSNTRDNQQW